MKGQRMEIMENKKTGLVINPTIRSLRDELDRLQQAGVNIDSPLMIAQLDKALGMFYIYQVDAGGRDAR